MKVKVQSFKPGGKFYVSDNIILDVKHYDEMQDQIAQMIRDARIPGLADGATGFHVVATPMTGNGKGVPHLFLIPRNYVER